MLPDYKWLPFKYPRRAYMVNPSKVPGILLFSICIFIWSTIGSNTHWYQRLNKDSQQLNKTWLGPTRYSLHRHKFPVKPVEYSAGTEKQRWPYTACLMAGVGRGWEQPFQICFRGDWRTNTTLQELKRPGNHGKSRFWSRYYGSVLCNLRVPEHPLCSFTWNGV